MNNLKKTWLNRWIVISFSILLVLMLLVIMFYFLKWKSNEITNTNSWNLLESNSWSSKTWSWTWPIQPITLDSYIQQIDDTDIDKALKLALKRYNDNWKNDLWDHEQLMYIYIDKWNYKEAIKLWKNALDIINEKLINEPWIIKTIISQLIQAYLYNWDLTSASTLLNKYSDLWFWLEKVMYEYKKWNFKYLLNNYEEIKKLSSSDVWIWLVLLAKYYSNKWDEKNAIKIYEELFNYSLTIELENPLDATYYLYYCSFILSTEFSNYLTSEKLKYYTDQNIIYKTRIDNKERIKYKDINIELYYNPDLMYFNIDRIINF